MPLSLASLSLPVDVVELVAGDVDGDGRDDLVAMTRTERAGSADRVTLAIYRFGADGAITGRSTVDLGDRPCGWDVERGLWLLDGEGIARVDAATGALTRVAKVSTPFTGLPAATPQRLRFAYDLDADKRPELFAWSAGRWLAFRTDGTALGGVTAPAEGNVSNLEKDGGRSFSTGLRAPPLVVEDLDGDGLRDVLLPAGAAAKAYYTGAAAGGGAGTLGARAATLRLPIDLDPPDTPAKPGETRRSIGEVRFTDLDGDRKADLFVQRTVSGQSFFGATSELMVARGTGTGFQAPVTLSAAAAAFGVELRDLEGDGDTDVVAPLVDVGMGTLARALVARSVRVDVSAWRATGATFASSPAALRSLAFPLDAPDRYLGDLSGDLDGDGRLDLVGNEGADRLRVWRGEGAGFASAVTAEAAVLLPSEPRLLVADLTGDGRDEVVLWGRRAVGASLLRLK